MSSFLERVRQELNPPQLEAVAHVHGPILILAGAGSGKTRVLTYRIANLIASGEAAPQQILAVTFTNKAAREMEHRILALLKNLGIPVYEQMWVSTFHSICARILRQEITRLGYQPFFTIYDDTDQLSILKKIIHAMNLNDKIYAPKMFQARIDEAKRLGMTPADLQKRPRFFMDDKVLPVFAAYENEMKKANALDFGDLLLKTYELFRDHPDIRERFAEQFQYIMVDEYQDTNHIQYLLVKLLSQSHRNLCVVGDEDQSIYSWRGADIQNILDFERDFPECKVVKLEENYRSTKAIVSAATAVIKNNSQRKDKTLFTQNEAGEKIVIYESSNEYEEARFVAQKIEQLMREKNYNRKDFAIFYRTNAQSRVIEDLMRSHSLPYRLVGGVKFYERMEIKDILGYLKALLNPTDEVALKRIINTPARGVGKTTVETIENTARTQNLDFFTAIRATAEQRLVNSGAAKKIRSFADLMDSLRQDLATKALSEIYIEILDKTQYVQRLKEEGTPESESRIQNLEEMQNAIRQFEEERGDEATLQNFLEEIALVTDLDKMDESQDFITLMTLHISKGLEFPVVFIVGCEEGLFPSSRAIDEASEEGLEEERRLAYVGMTRARQRLFMTHTRIRRVWGQEQQHPPSRFLNELPREFVQVESQIQRPKFLDKYAGYSAGGAEPRYSSAGVTTSFADRVKQRRGEQSQGDEFDQMPDYENFSDTPGPSTSGGGPQAYVKGMRVRHPTFGAGSIFQVEGSGDEQKISVVFSDRTFKKFVAKYARLEII
ncbi:MAG: ATP-dependent helicase [Bdellovibrionales bacterium]